MGAVPNFRVAGRYWSVGHWVLDRTKRVNNLHFFNLFIIKKQILYFLKLFAASLHYICQWFTINVCLELYLDQFFVVFIRYTLMASDIKLVCGTKKGWGALLYSTTEVYIIKWLFYWPYFILQVKYWTPATEPSFFPSGLSSSTPAQRPPENSVLPQNCRVPTCVQQKV